MAGFESETCGVRSDRPTNCATLPPYSQQLSLFPDLSLSHTQLFLHRNRVRLASSVTRLGMDF